MGMLIYSADSQMCNEAYVNILFTISLNEYTVAGVIGVVVSSLALHRDDPGSIPGFGIQAVRIHA